MNQLLDLLQGSAILYNSRFYNIPSYSLMLLRCKSCLYNGKYAAFQQTSQYSWQAACSTKVVDHVESRSILEKVNISDEAKLDTFPCVQTLRQFPKEELSGNVVMVRFESNILRMRKQDQHTPVVISALSTIKYLYESGAKVILAGNWSEAINSKILTVESVAEFLSLVLQLKVLPVKLFPGNLQPLMEQSKESNILLLDNLSQFKEEPANCSEFSKYLSSGIDIFVNDAFSQCHRILASTVGVASFCYSSIAGFCFEEDLCQLKEALRTTKNPYVAIIGGSNLFDKAAALYSLASICDGLVFVGNMAFQLMHALGLPVPMKMVEQGAFEEALRIIQFTKARSMSILLPKDFWCMSDHSHEQLEIFSASCIPDGWSPVDLGPNTLEEITSLLSTCKKIMWIGPVKFGSLYHNSGGTSKVAQMLETLSQGNCDITVIGDAACKALLRESRSLPICYTIENASLVWEYLKGRKLPGLMALDRAYPFEIDWNAIYTDIARPLIVDIGSGNGMFLFKMARRSKDMNYLGLEINQKLVRRCVDTVHQSGIRNGYFLATNATSTFRSIVSSYPGELVLVSIQCPNPDFNKPEHRWRMVQRSLVEAVADLLTSDGKVFLQSDIEAVALRMKEQFILHGKGRLNVVSDQENTAIGQGEWLKENPFGVRSDWEEHVIKRGNPMYRVMLSKSTSN